MSDIDVSKCEFYYDNYCGCCIDSYGDCYHKCTDEELNNCYYKQLQQLKAENEELKQEIASLELDYNALYDTPTITEERYKNTLDEIEKYCMYVKNISYDIKDCTQFTYYGGAKDTANHILLDIIKQAKEREE